MRSLNILGNNNSPENMADKKSFVGARLRVTTSEGEYEGTVHSIDAGKRKLTLTKGEKTMTFLNATIPHALPEGK